MAMRVLRAITALLGILVMVESIGERDARFG